MTSTVQKDGPFQKPFAELMRSPLPTPNAPASAPHPQQPPIERPAEARVRAAAVYSGVAPRAPGGSLSVPHASNPRPPPLPARAPL